tara:strand:+ start:1378 stop:1539 length:162 start_codon:yes stop_codon:yes gene_type:complete
MKQNNISNITVNINYDKLHIKNTKTQNIKLINMKILPKQSQVSALAAIYKCLN